MLRYDSCCCCAHAARDYVEGMWRILQQDTPEDFVLATGETHTVREFVEKSFAELDIKIKYVQSYYPSES